MQLKLLNFHKVLAQFAQNLLTTFIPLIVYGATGVLAYALLACMAEHLLRVVLDMAFRKLYFKYPQIILILRVVPMVLCAGSLIVIDYNFILGIIGAIVFNALSFAFRNVPQEIVLNYSTVGKSSGSLGLTRLFENVGTLLGVVLGGLFLDNINKLFVILLASGIYILSVVPLVIFYIRGKKNNEFNRDISTDMAEYNYKSKSKTQSQVSRKMMFGYFSLYVSFGPLDFLPSLTTLSIYFNFSGQYFISGLATGLYLFMFGLGSTIAGKLEEKFDLTKWFSVAAFLISGISMGIFFSRNVVLTLVLSALSGGLYSIISIFSISRLLPRTRIMGLANEGMIARNSGSLLGMAITAASAAAFGLIGGFITVSVMLIITAILGPTNEERTRAMLVDFINDNDYLESNNPMLRNKLKKLKKEREEQEKENNTK